MTRTATGFANEKTMNRIIFKYKRLLVLSKLYFNFYTLLSTNDDGIEDPYEEHVVLALETFVKNLEKKNRQRKWYSLSKRKRSFRFVHNTKVKVRHFKCKSSTDLRLLQTRATERTEGTHIRFESDDEEDKKENIHTRFESDEDEMNTPIRFYSETELDYDVAQQQLREIREERQRMLQYYEQEEIRRRKVLEEYFNEIDRSNQSIDSTGSIQEFLIIILQVFTVIVCFIVLSMMTSSIGFNVFWAIVIGYTTWRQQ